jgi:Cu/Ag efflux protein CusF
MKTSFFYRQLILIILALVFAGTLPTEAARVRRVRTLQTGTFLVASNATIVVGTNHMASLSDLNVGDRVSLAYAQENGASVVHRIADGVPHKPRNSDGNPSPKPHSQTGVSLLHAHGFIQSVDVQAGTVTITRKLR